MKRWFSALISHITIRWAKWLNKEALEYVAGLHKAANIPPTLSGQDANTIGQADIAHLSKDFQEIIKKRGLGRMTGAKGSLIDYLEYKD